MEEEKERKRLKAEQLKKKQQELLSNFLVPKEAPKIAVPKTCNGFVIKPFESSDPAVLLSHEPHSCTIADPLPFSAGTGELGPITLKRKYCPYRKPAVVDWGDFVQSFSRIKFLYFHENNRPGYIGTYSKSSTIISGRKFYAKDNTLFDYEYDSDDEWEQGEGETLSDDDNECEEDDDEEQQVGFVVPDDYFSEDELQDNETVQLSSKTKIRTNTQGDLIPIVHGPYFLTNPRSHDKSFSHMQRFKGQVLTDHPLPLPVQRKKRRRAKKSAEKSRLRKQAKATEKATVNTEKSDAQPTSTLDSTETSSEKSIQAFFPATNPNYSN